MFEINTPVVVIAKATSAWDSIEPHLEGLVGVVVDDPLKSTLVESNWVMVKFPDYEEAEGFYPEELQAIEPS